MHTALCTFDTREQAERARDQLLGAGYARHDLHIEHRHGTAATDDANSRWDGMEREIAVDTDVLESFGRFFVSLLGKDHADRYAQHVERGAYVVVVDAGDELQAQRASTLLHEMQGSDLNVVHRQAQRPLRDIVGERQAGSGTAGMVERSREPYEGRGSVAGSASPGDRALASHTVSPRTGPELRDPEVEHAPGLRYADKDKPL